MDPSGRIAELLDDESPRKRIAAAMVLGELKAKDAGVKTRCPRLVNATPEVRAMLSQLLPAVGGRQSLEMAFEGCVTNRGSAQYRAGACRSRLDGARAVARW